MKYLPLNSKLFSTNRDRFVKKMQKDSMAIFVANEEVSQNADALYKYNQTVPCTGLLASDRKKPC